MNKRAVKIALLFLLITGLAVYGWNLFQNLNYNRLVFATDIYTHVSSDAQKVTNFSRNHYFNDYAHYDTINNYLLDQIKDYATYPIIVSRFDDQEDLILLKATKEQELNIKKTLQTKVAPHHQPKMKLYKNTPLYFYSLPNNEFLICSFCTGIFAASKNYKRIEEMLDLATTSSFFKTDNAKQEMIVKRLYENNPVSMFFKTDSTLLAVAYTLESDTIMMEGVFFEVTETSDTINSITNKIRRTLDAPSNFTDSIQCGEMNKVIIMLNKAI